MVDEEELRDLLSGMMNAKGKTDNLLSGGLGAALALLALTR